MSRALAHIILATILLFCALVIGLRLFVSVSLPSIITPPLGIQVVQASNISGVLRATSTQLEKPKEGLNFNLTQINFGIWAACFDRLDNASSTCFEVGSPTISDSDGTNVGIIGSSFTRGQPIASIATFAAAFIEICSTKTINSIMAWLANLSIWVALLAAALTLIAVAIDIALLVQVRLNGFGAGITTQPAPGFWSVISTCLVFLLIGSFTQCLGKLQRRKEQRKLDMESNVRNSSTMTNTKT